MRLIILFLLLSISASAQQNKLIWFLMGNSGGGPSPSPANYAGTDTTSDATILVSIEPEINGTNPQVRITTGASAANYKFSLTAICSYLTY